MLGWGGPGIEGMGGELKGRQIKPRRGFTKKWLKTMEMEIKCSYKMNRTEESNEICWGGGRGKCEMIAHLGGGKRDDPPIGRG